MQRGRIIILGDAGVNLGDSMYDGTIYVGGEVKGLGTDAVPAELSELDVEWLNRKLTMYGLDAPRGVENLTKIVSGKELWNYDSLEPHERKMVL
jgi:glutamate synthase domain-containing protein 3